MGKRGEKRKKERERGNEKDRWERRWKINLDKNKLGAPFGGDGAKPREAQPAIVGVVIGRVGGRSVAVSGGYFTYGTGVRDNTAGFGHTYQEIGLDTLLGIGCHPEGSVALK